MCVLCLGCVCMCVSICVFMCVGGHVCVHMCIWAARVCVCAHMPCVPSHLGCGRASHCVPMSVYEHWSGGADRRSSCSAAVLPLTPSREPFTCCRVVLEPQRHSCLGGRETVTHCVCSGRTPPLPAVGWRDGRPPQRLCKYLGSSTQLGVDPRPQLARLPLRGRLGLVQGCRLKAHHGCPSSPLPSEPGSLVCGRALSSSLALLKPPGPPHEDKSGQRSCPRGGRGRRTSPQGAWRGWGSGQPTRFRVESSQGRAWPQSPGLPDLRQKVHRGPRSLAPEGSVRRRQLGPFLCSWVFFWKSASLSAGVSPPPSLPLRWPGTRKAELCRTCGPPLCSRQVCRRPLQWARLGTLKETVTPVFMKDPRQLLCPVTLSDQSPSDPWAEKSRR